MAPSFCFMICISESRTLILYVCTYIYITSHCHALHNHNNNNNNNQPCCSAACLLATARALLLSLRAVRRELDVASLKQRLPQAAGGKGEKGEEEEVRCSNVICVDDYDRSMALLTPPMHDDDVMHRRRPPLPSSPHLSPPTSCPSSPRKPRARRRASWRRRPSVRMMSLYPYMDLNSYTFCLTYIRMCMYTTGARALAVKCRQAEASGARLTWPQHQQKPTMGSSGGKKQQQGGGGGEGQKRDALRAKCRTALQEAFEKGVGRLLVASSSPSSGGGGGGSEGAWCGVPVDSKEACV